MVISSPVVVFINPILHAASAAPLPTISTTPSAPSTIGQDGKDGDFTTQAALSSVTAKQTNNIVNTKSYYDIIFVTATTGTIKTIQITFPVGTSIGETDLLLEREGIGAGTAEKTGSRTITYTVNNAVSVPAGTKIRLEFSTINNPVNAGTNYVVTVTTRNAANTPIDGPTQSTAYTMKQIGPNAIANNAITAPKIADGAILPNTILVNSAPVNVPPGTSRSGIAVCPPDHPIITGGGGLTQVGSEAFLRLTDSFDPGGNLWQAFMFNEHPSQTFFFTTRATCMAPMP
jgi:hypothetical protein